MHQTDGSCDRRRSASQIERISVFFSWENVLRSTHTSLNIFIVSTHIFQTKNGIRFPLGCLLSFWVFSFFYCWNVNKVVSSDNETSSIINFCTRKHFRLRLNYWITLRPSPELLISLLLTK